jgi:hypothetical protein
MFMSYKNILLLDERRLFIFNAINRPIPCENTVYS